MKRKRSSRASTNLEGTLPALAEALYQSIEKKDLAAVRSLAVDGVRGAGQLGGDGARAEVGRGREAREHAHRDRHVDLTRGSASGIHKLEFDDDGLITKSEVFTTAA